MKINNILVSPNISIRQAMKDLSASGKKCLLVVNSDNKFLGTLTDGDIRKAILKGININQTISNIYQNESTILKENDYNSNQVKKLFIKLNVDLFPVVNNNGELTKVILWSDIFKNGKNVNKQLVYVPVVIMAGGRGTRMEPFTKILPKPLIPIDNKPIIEHIINHFSKVGCREYYLTVNYKANIMKAYFEELKPKYKISFIDESKPLGTAGSLRLIQPKFDKPFFVTNCDIIIKGDYESIYNFHIQGDYDITLVASTKEYIIPYGTCELNQEGGLSRINEKPHYDFLINTGLYVISPNVVELIPSQKSYDITTLIEDSLKSGKKIGVFPVNDESWIDIGQWNEYKQAVGRL
jgi:dTDP-glucose pyrophosphorylase